MIPRIHPTCETCGEDTMCVNTVMVTRLEVFCGNEKCPQFVQSFWVER